MVEKLDQFEVQKEVSLLIDSLEPKERREVMAALAERFGLKLTDKATVNGNGLRPTYRKKRVY